MSKDKHRRLTRRLKLLREAAESPLVFHRIGGLAMKDRDVQRLIQDGHLKFSRFGWNGRRLSPKRFVGNFRRDYSHRDEYAPRESKQALGCREDFRPQGELSSWGVFGKINITRGVITDAGLAFLEGQGSGRNAGRAAKDKSNRR